MLSTTQISQRIQNPNLVVPDDLPSLKELTEKYPYTQLFSILYLKALSKSGDVRFEDELKRHSYRISDRVQLYELMQEHEGRDELKAESDKLKVESEKPKEEGDTSKAKSEKLKVESEKLEEPTAVLESVSEEAEETVESEEVSDKLEAEVDKLKVEGGMLEEPAPVPESISDEVEETVESVEVSNKLKVESEKSKAESEKPEETHEIESDELEVENEEIDELEAPSEQIEHELSVEEEFVEFELELEEQSEVEPSISEPVEAKDKLDETILHHALASNYHLEDLSEEEEAALEAKVEPEVAEPTASKEAPSSFTGWLHSNNNYVEQDTSDKEAIDAVVEDFAEFDPSSDLFGEVEKPKTEFFSPTKKAKKSLEENELPVSETLAKIYIMQGNYPQAIAAYQQLSLAFPEKKIFFANLIEDLEKKINT